MPYFTMYALYVTKMIITDEDGRRNVLELKYFSSVLVYITLEI